MHVRAINHVLSRRGVLRVLLVLLQQSNNSDVERRTARESEQRSTAAGYSPRSLTAGCRDATVMGGTYESKPGHWRLASTVPLYANVTDY